MAKLVSGEEAFYKVDAIAHDTRPFAAVNADGAIDKQQLEAACFYWLAFARARQILGIVKGVT